MSFKLGNTVSHTWWLIHLFHIQAIRELQICFIIFLLLEYFVRMASFKLCCSIESLKLGKIYWFYWPLDIDKTPHIWHVVSQVASCSFYRMYSLFLIWARWRGTVAYCHQWLQHQLPSTQHRNSKRGYYGWFVSLSQETCEGDIGASSYPDKISSVDDKQPTIDFLHVEYHIISNLKSRM